jgi:hypothetical protein
MRCQRLSSRLASSLCLSASSVLELVCVFSGVIAMWSGSYLPAGYTFSSTVTSLLRQGNHSKAHVQESQKKYTSRSTALVAPEQTFAYAISYTNGMDEWIHSGKMQLFMSGNDSDYYEAHSITSGDVSGKNVGLPYA